MSDTTGSAREPSKLEAREHVARLAASNDLQAGLLASVAHDLRTPLHLIAGTAETLTAHGEHLTEADRDELLDGLRRTALRACSLLDDLLDVERDAAGMLTVDVETVDLLLFARQFSTELPDEIAPRVEVIGTSVPARLDPKRAERIVENLVTNAAKYAPRRSTITLRVSDTDGVPTLAVEDEGQGVGIEVRLRVFSPFERLEGADERASGSGLGLYIVAVLARAMGAVVAVDDAPSGGAAFRVMFRRGDTLPPMLHSV